MNTGTTTEQAVKGLSDKVLQYFREFIASDFKRLAVPRRRVVLKTQEGYRCAIDLRKYGSFFKDAWQMTAKHPQEMSLPIGRRKYRAQISPVLKNLVEQFVGNLAERGLDDVRSGVVREAVGGRVKGGENPERYVDSVVAKFGELTAAHVVHPLLALLEGPFKENAYAAEDSVFEVESELTDMLCKSAAENISGALNHLLLTGDPEKLQKVLADCFTLESVQDQVKTFFESFAAADAYQEVRDLLNYMRSEDVLTAYLYFGSVKFGVNDYPLFYIPVGVKQEAEGSGYVLSAEPRLFIHKQAIEFVVSELKREAERVSMAVIPERIVHLVGGASGETHTAQSRMVSTMRDLTRSLELAGEIDLTDVRPQLARSPQLRISNAAYLAVFDRGDESLVNDYEALLSSLETDHVEASAMFQGIVRSMIFDDPVSVSGQVRDEWAEMSTADRLVTASPIPLNEEQIRIECARRKEGCRFIAVEGPPGTGKSHTITALTFNAIMEHRSVLIISDKGEALDVVEDKLGQALRAVRHGEDFPNPILRLGQDGTYRSLMSGASRVRIQGHHQAQSANMKSVDQELATESATLSKRIGDTVKSLTDVGLGEVQEIHALERKIESTHAGLAAEVVASTGQAELARVKSALEQWKRVGDKSAGVKLATQAVTSLAALEDSLKVMLVAERAAVQKDVKAALGLFSPMRASRNGEVLGWAAKGEALKLPVLGFLFKGKKLAALDAEIATSLPCINAVGIARRFIEVRMVSAAMGTIAQHASASKLPDERTEEVYSLLSGESGVEVHAVEAFALVEAVRAVACRCASWGNGEVETESALGFVEAIAGYITGMDHMTKKFCSVPKVDFVSEKKRLEALHTARLAHQMDSRFLKFVEEHRATAQALGGVIKQRGQFPTEQFKTLRDAFPCVICGVRELGEFVPMKTGVFDLLIIDEGSQLSLAQAMPAMLRAKQVVVFGDRKQFSNVKSHNASTETNASYMSGIHEEFRANIGTAADKLERLQRFDVKRSVLDFMGLVANHQEMLRKHFRGFPELIGYCSKNFYQGGLQAIKVRAVPIEEVLQFDVLEHDGRAEKKNNTNSVEAAHVIELLEGMLVVEEGETAPSVAIITPHREQAALISAMVVRHKDGERFEQELKLKTFTFDTCQGEERDVIVYSMVATRERDMLNYVFPVSLSVDEDENDSMKAQRLNVGFSRAKQCMVFVLSKRPEEFKGSIGQALLHFERTLNEKVIAEDVDTDASSPMERKVLGWLKQTAFMQMESERVELVAQFPVGEYLKQLDGTYRHPAYKVDFLLRHDGGGSGGKRSNIIIEYDGFAEHFTNREKVTAANYERYYRPEDVERQFVLESYGYRFLRICRFNLGADPVATLDARLREMVLGDGGEGGAAVSRIKEQAQQLGDGEAKVCSRCKTIRQLPDYYDKALNGGLGGNGRVCVHCKAEDGRSAFSGVKVKGAAGKRRSFGSWRNGR